MTYKSSILYDYPIAYYPLDESGSAAFDYSGCENDGTYTGSFEANLLPLLCGPTRASKITSTTSIAYSITKDYSAASTDSKFATASSSDNDFTIEFWFYPQITTTNETILVADNTNDVGVFYQKGNIIFKLDSQSLEYTLPSTNKVFHVAVVYSVSSASIYIDGQLVKYKNLDNFSFTNTSVSLASGPAANVADAFLINSLAVYRYALSKSQIEYHFAQGQGLPAIQVASTSNGELFEMYDDEMSCLYKFVYPQSKPWGDVVKTGLTYNQSLNCLEITETDSAAASTIVVDDFISIPTTATLDSSKIEWDGDNGISIQTSIDGTTYTSCVNGQQIPGYTLNSFGSTGKLYVRITFTSSDTSRYIPRLFNLSILFYNNQIKYAYNGNSYMTTLEEETGISDYRVTLGKMPYDILSRNSRNGIRTVVDSGFEITTNKSISTLEFFYTPAALTDSGLVSTLATNGYAASQVRWSNSGTMSKTNISAIYVNGVNKTAETNVSGIFKANELHHVVVVFGSAVSSDIRFNYSTNGSVSALYQNIALYESAFNSTAATNNYNIYIGKQSSTITDTSVTTLTEDAVSSYDNDWLVVQNV